MLWYFCRGEMAERLNAPVLKTDVLKGTGGSNPSFSASEKLHDKSWSFFISINWNLASKKID